MEKSAHKLILVAIALTLATPVRAQTATQPVCEYSDSPRTIMDGTTGPLQCDKSGHVLIGDTCQENVPINVVVGNTTQLVSATVGKIIGVCSFSVSISDVGNAAFIFGDIGTCSGGQITGAMQMPAMGSISMSAGNNFLFRTPESASLCLAATSGTVSGFISYSKF